MHYKKKQVIPISARALLLTILPFFKKFHIVETCVVYQPYFPLRKGTFYDSEITGISGTFSSCYKLKRVDWKSRREWTSSLEKNDSKLISLISYIFWLQSIECISSGTIRLTANITKYFLIIWVRSDKWYSLDRMHMLHFLKKKKHQ